MPAERKQKLFTPVLEHYVYGWVINIVPANDPGAGQTIIAHGGGINGFNALEQRFVDDHDLIVLFNHVPGPDLGEMGKGIRAVLYGQEPKLPKRMLVNVLGDTIVHRGVEASVAQYRELKRTNPDGYDFGEQRLNSLGYILLERNRTADAIVMFKLNAEEYPNRGMSATALPKHMKRTARRSWPSKAIASRWNSIQTTRMPKTS